jgi:hypothetical protein
MLMKELVVRMICGGLLGGALPSSQLGFVFLVSNSRCIGFVYRGIVAYGITDT